MATREEAIERLIAQGLSRSQAEQIVANDDGLETNVTPILGGLALGGATQRNPTPNLEGYNTVEEEVITPVEPNSNQGEPGGFDPELFKQQANIRDIEHTTDDWRFRMRLAPRSQDLYKSGDPGILRPLVETDGVIFPYTPQIQINYQANYSESQPTHSNYKQLFYQNSAVTDINLTATFTAQSTREADYLLAAIHFFKSCTKMFYGQDQNKGAPPPLVYLDGFGEHQFNEMPCVINQFNYMLPGDVDYVRTSGDSGAASIDLSEKRASTTSYKSPLSRLFDLFSQGIGKGGGPRNSQRVNPIGSLSQGKQDYVPTKIEFTLILLPIVTRKRQATEFSLEKYASGELLSKRGMW